MNQIWDKKEPPIPKHFELYRKLLNEKEIKKILTPKLEK